jgi:chorismate dehydratase
MPVRVGRIEFVNCFPLYHHFEEELDRRGLSAVIVEGYPSQLNEMLVDDLIDVALPSSIAFARAAPQLVQIPHVSISAFGAVDSVQLFTRLPLPDVRRIALTEKSATSICLLKVLCREWGLEPEYIPRRGSLAEVLADADGLLLIGDEALYVLRAEVYPYHYDLGEEWRTVTGLPMVFAVCAVRREFAAARPQAAEAVGAALLASRDRCAARPEETAAAAAQRYDFSMRYLLDYFRKLRFEFTREYRAGLDEFYRRAVSAGELVAAPDLAAATFHPGPGDFGGAPDGAPEVPGDGAGQGRAAGGSGASSTAAG